MLTYEECGHTHRPTLLTEDRCTALFDAAVEVMGLHGHFYECGVYEGGISQLLAEVIKRSGVRRELHIFDSFAGLPKSDPQIDHHRQGEFTASVDGVRTRLADYPDVFVHQGWIPGVFAANKTDRIAFAHIDLDLYRSTKDALAFVWPRLVERGCIIVDDYGIESCRGVEKAVSELLAGRSEECLVTARCRERS
jgi:O-methyltransferase